MSILKDDIVEVIAGDDRGKSGKVIEVLRSVEKVVVEGINIKKRHKKADREGKGGGILDFPSPIHVSNVRLKSRSEEPVKARSSKASK
jgi:large subunit ribosomal protein L24